MGAAESKQTTEWKPRVNVKLLDKGKETEDSFSCACMKGCAINAKKSKFLCANADTRSVGSEDVELPSDITTSGGSGKSGQCACKCGTSWG